MKIKELLLFICISATLWNCSSDDSNRIIDDFDNGAVVETVTITNNAVSSDTLEGGLDTILEYRDSENGALLDDFNIYVTFLDNTDNTGNNPDVIEGQEVFLRSIEATDFMIGTAGFPQFNLMISTEDFLTATNNTLEGIAPEDEYIIRFELILTDGRVFSTNNTGISGGLIGTFSIITPVE